MDIRRDFDVAVEISAMPSVLDEGFLKKKTIRHVLRAAPIHPVLGSVDAVADEEYWPFAPASLDALISVCHLQWVNDLPGALVQFRRSLKPDGVFIGAFFGGETLMELRASIQQAETEIYGGISPRVSPFVGLQDMAALMQRAQFALPVADHEFVTVTYEGIGALINDLRVMGQEHAVVKRDRRILARHFWPRVEEIYRQNFSTPQGKLKATVEIIHVLGWAPHASQPQPLKRGSATHSLVDVLGK